MNGLSCVGRVSEWVRRRLGQSAEVTAYRLSTGSNGNRGAGQNNRASTARQGAAQRCVAFDGPGTGTTITEDDTATALSEQPDGSAVGFPTAAENSTATAGPIAALPFS